jgi:hypothetical protein
VNDIRGKHDTAVEAAACVGHPEFARDINTVTNVRNAARVISDMNADLICLIVERRRRLMGAAA